MADSNIGWTDKTWPVVAGCEWCSEGCDRCFAARDAAARLKNHPRYRGLSIIEVNGQPARFTGEVRLNWDVLVDPLRWRVGARVFVASQADLFHSKVPMGYLMDVWRVMSMCPHHTFQVLTKRPKRMRQFLDLFADTERDSAADLIVAGQSEKPGRCERCGDEDVDPLGPCRDFPGELLGPHQVMGHWPMPPMPRGPVAVLNTYGSGRARLFSEMLAGHGDPPEGAAYPLYDWQNGMRYLPQVLPNVGTGISVENDRWGRIRVPHLAATRSAWRFISAEPLLGPLPGLDLTNIHQVIVGGESGADRGVRRMDPGWAREILALCREGVDCEECSGSGSRVTWVGPGTEIPCPTCAGTGTRKVAFFFKQAGKVLAREWGMKGAGHLKPGDPDYEKVPEDLRIQEDARVAT